MMNLLIIDDEPKVRKGLKKLLKKKYGEEMCLYTFDNALESLDFLRLNSVDLIICDIKMPGMNGLELIEEIRKENTKIDIVILSGFGYFEYAQRAIDLNVRKYLTKPTDTKELFNVINQIRDHIAKKTDPRLVEPLRESQNIIIAKCLDYVDKHFCRKLSLKEIADNLFVSPNYLSMLFKEEMGVNLFEYIQMLRLEKAKIYLNDISYKIFEVSEMVGYQDTKYFSTLFKKNFGITPKEYRNNEHNISN